MGLSKNIAYRLQTLRGASGLSQQEVAERADLSLSLVAKMEQGRKADPRASTLIALAGALGVRPGQLIEDLTPPPEGTFPSKKGKDKDKDKDKKKGKKKKLPTDQADAPPDATGLPDVSENGVNGVKGARKKKKKKEK